MPIVIPIIAPIAIPIVMPIIVSIIMPVYPALFSHALAYFKNVLQA